jgi:hypothetical protein
MTHLTLPRRTALTVIGTAPFFLSPPLTAQSTAPVFDRLVGEWHGEGVLLGRTAEFAMSWAHRDGLAILTFANALADSAGEVTPVLEAAAIYRSAYRTPEGVWLDSRGVRVEIRWQATDSTLMADWSAPDEEGRTTYRVLADDAVEVTDEVRTAEGWRTFGTARYRRASVPQGGPLDEPVGLELAQLVGQHLLGDLGDRLLVVRWATVHVDLIQIGGPSERSRV